MDWSLTKELLDTVIKVPLLICDFLLLIPLLFPRLLPDRWLSCNSSILCRAVSSFWRIFKSSTSLICFLIW